MASGGTLRQSAEGTWSDPSSATFGSAPVQDNLLIAVLEERSGGSSANHVLSGITGWTHEVSRTMEQSNGTYRRTFSIFYKVAAASEVSTVTGDDGTGNNKKLSIYEYEHTGDGDQWILLESASNDNGATSNATSISTGTTASASATSMFIFGGMGLKFTGSPGSSRTYTWDTGLTSDFNGSSAGNQMFHCAGSDETDTVTGTKSSTCTQDTGAAANLGLAAGILVFSIESGGGGGATGKSNPLFGSLGGCLSGVIA